MEDAVNETACWLRDTPDVEVEIGVLIAAASAWTEDETELDDLVHGLVDSGRVHIAIG